MDCWTQKLDRKTNSSPDRWTSILTGSDETCERGGSKMTLLRIDSSARKASITRQLTARFAEEWKMKHPNGDVMHRDVSTPALPLITDDWSATNPEASTLSPAQQSYLATSDELIEELRAAETIVIGAPMYNFSIPSSL